MNMVFLCLSSFISDKCVMPMWKHVSWDPRWCASLVLAETYGILWEAFIKGGRRHKFVATLLIYLLFLRSMAKSLDGNCIDFSCNVSIFSTFWKNKHALTWTGCHKCLLASTSSTGNIKSLRNFVLIQWAYCSDTGHSPGTILDSEFHHDQKPTFFFFSPLHPPLTFRDPVGPLSPPLSFSC